MNKELSILLPGSFFEEGYQSKLELLSEKNFDCVYLFDHTVNPSDGRKAMYEIKKAISLIQNNSHYSFDLGLCVLNVNRRKLDLLFTKYINPMLEIEKFRLGLGTGDNRYEKKIKEFSHDLDSMISDLVDQYKFSHKGRNLFIGGTSQKKIDLVKKYSIGVNQWFGDEKKLQSLIDNIGNKKSFLGRFSHCQKTDISYSDLSSNFEKIFVLKDSDIEEFYSQVDKILL